MKLLARLLLFGILLSSTVHARVADSLFYKQTAKSKGVLISENYSNCNPPTSSTKTFIVSSETNESSGQAYDVFYTFNPVVNIIETFGNCARTLPSSIFSSFNPADTLLYKYNSGSVFKLNLGLAGGNLICQDAIASGSLSTNNFLSEIDSAGKNFVTIGAGFGNSLNVNAYSTLTNSLTYSGVVLFPANNFFINYFGGVFGTKLKGDMVTAPNGRIFIIVSDGSTSKLYEIENLFNSPASATYVTTFSYDLFAISYSEGNLIIGGENRYLVYDISSGITLSNNIKGDGLNINALTSFTYSLGSSMQLKDKQWISGKKYRIKYLVSGKNLGNVPLSNFQLSLDLSKAFPGLTVSNISVSTISNGQNLSINSAYSGTGADTLLLQGSQLLYNKANALSNSTDEITLQVQFDVDDLAPGTVYKAQSYASSINGTCDASSAQNYYVKLLDASNDGLSSSIDLDENGRSDDAGEDNKTSFNVTEPYADFSFSPLSGCGRTTVAFTNLSNNGVDGQTTNLSYDWNFDNGKTSTKKNPGSITFSPNKNSATTTFNVRLIVTDTKFGIQDTVIKSITLSRGAVAMLTALSPTRTYAGETYFARCAGAQYDTVIIRDGASDLNTVVNSVPVFYNSGYIINWGDGGLDSSFTRFPTNGLRHVYSKGYYTIKFIATKGGSCNDTAYYNVFVGDNPDLGLASIGSTTICTGDSLRFTISNTANNPPPTVYQFYINDGRDMIEYSHPLSGTIGFKFDKSSCGNVNDDGRLHFYEMKVVANSICSYKEQTVSPIIVTEKPIASFSKSANVICQNNIITFINTGVKGQTIDVRLSPDPSTCESNPPIWSVNPDVGVYPVGSFYGDTVILFFDTPGKYYIEMELQSGGGCGSSRYLDSVFVNPVQPLFDFQLDDPIICAGETPIAAITPTNTMVSGVVTYTWFYSHVSACKLQTLK